MTVNEEKEICREFKEAKDKAAQIDIIAQLRCIDRQKVVLVLGKHGFEVPRKKWSRKQKEPETKPEHQMQDVIREAVAEKLDKIDKRIKELEPVKKEYDGLVKKYELLSQYLCS